MRSSCGGAKARKNAITLMSATHCEESESHES